MKVVFSAKLDHDIIKNVVKKLKSSKEHEFVFHDPRVDFFNLNEIPHFFENIDFLIVKVGSEFSIDLLHLAKMHNIPVLHDIDTVLICKNKIALDGIIRKIFQKKKVKSLNFKIPRSWNHNVSNIRRFKEWASKKLPLVIKSHNQHDKYNRFNFLVRKIDEIDVFCERYKEFLYYDVYIQEYIECDGIDRKIYVIGDKVYGIQRENPICVFIRDQPEDIDVDRIKRDSFLVSPEIKSLASILSKELGLKLFGFDLLKPLHEDTFYLVDLNDFPGFRGINDIEDIIADYIIKMLTQNKFI
ncbi:MAG: RimK family alpha-L-glutamate ligase [Promethearchaeota archaeon]